jgi:autotransporter-associated beta strand protein
MKSKSKFGKSVFSSAIIVCLAAAPAARADWWVAGGPGDWNVGTNWNSLNVPNNAGGWAIGEVINGTATISSAVPQVSEAWAGNNGMVGDIIVASGGTLNVSNWLVAARNGGGGNTPLSNIRVEGGTVNKWGDGFLIGEPGNCRGALHISGDGVVNVTGGWFGVGNDSGWGWVYLKDNAKLSLSDGRDFNIGDYGTNTRGWCYVQDNARIDVRKFWVGKNDTAGVMIQSGGTVQGYTPTANEWRIAEGTNSYGFYQLSGGAFINPNNFQIGASGNGLWYQSGGATTTSGWTAPGRYGSGRGVIHLTGGTFAHTGTGPHLFCTEEGRGAINVSGSGILDTNLSLVVANGGASNGVLNVNSGGTVKVPQFERWNGNALVNLNGGTIQAKRNEAAFLQNMTDVRVYPGGAIFDTAGFNITVGQALLAPTGSGVATVPVTDGGSGYMGPPIVEITGGGGGGATAVAIMADDGLGAGTYRLDSIVITCAGRDFTGAPTVTLYGGMPATAATLDTPTLAANTSGGLTKLGDGTLTLTGASTYSGATTVTKGKLVLPTRDSATSGDCTVADGTTLGITQTDPSYSLTVPNATFGTTGATTLDVNLGAFAGNPTAAPLNVATTLTLNGPVTLNVTDLLPATGPIPLVSYVGPKAGAGSFVLGTLPNGVQATLVDNGTNLVSLSVSSVALPIWTGATDTTWDIGTTENWVDGVTTLPSTYSDLAPVLFDDTASDSLVTLDTTVTPSKVTFNNSIYDYTLEGTGKITGLTPLIKQGTKSLTLSLTGNDYTGPTTITGGTVSVPTLANGGSPSSIGASPAGAANLVLGGATLNYTGPAVVIDRGLTVGGNGAVINLTDTHDLTLGGPIVCDSGNLAKTGAGKLTLTHPGANVLGTNNPGVRVDGGTLVLSGSGTQTNAVGGELFVGSLANVPAELVLNGTSLTVQSWIAVGRGNGDTDTISKLTATDSTIVSGNFSTGWDDGRPNNSIQEITLTNSTWTNNGASQLAESVNATGTMTLTNSTYTAGNFRAAMNGSCVATVNLVGNSTVTSNGWAQFGEGADSVVTLNFNDLTGTSSFTSTGSLFGQGQRAKVNMAVGGTTTFTSNGRFQVSLNGTADNVSECTITVQDNGKIIKNGEWFSIGNDGKATMTVKDYGSVWSDGDFNIGDVGISDGTLYIQDSATVTSTGPAFIGKGVTTKGALIQTGGTFTCSNWIPVGRFVGAVGIVEVSGGTFNHTGAGTALWVGEEGTGTLTIKTAGAVNSTGFVALSNGAAAIGTLNLEAGGTLTALRITEGAGGAGMGTFNFNGGTLIAGAGAEANFMDLLDGVNVQAAGAFINTNGQNITINQNLGYSDDGTGALTKSGAGALYLNGTHTYTGATTVTEGTLGGNGAVAGPLVVNAGTTVAPGTSAGTLAAGNTTVTGTYACEIDGATADKLVVNGTLDVSAGTLAVSQLTLPTAPVYIIATYTGATPAPFATVTGVSPDYTVDYAYNNGETSTNIALVATAYKAWALANITAIDPTADATRGGDPDGDGQTNITEFALNGNPLSAAASGKVVGQVATVAGSPTLVLSLPVRTGATFTGDTEQVSTLIDGVVYKIQGSDELGTWNLAVSEVLGADKATIEAGLPALGTGWTYRTFQSPGAVTDDPADFLRAVIVNP